MLETHWNACTAKTKREALEGKSIELEIIWDFSADLDPRRLIVIWKNPPHITHPSAPFTSLLRSCVVGPEQRQNQETK